MLQDIPFALTNAPYIETNSTDVYYLLIENYDLFILSANELTS